MKKSIYFTLPVLFILIVFNLATSFIDRNSGNLPIGFIHGLSSVVVLIAALIHRIASRGKSSRPLWLAILALITINCFSLNIDIELFSPFSKWVYGYLGSVYAILILYYSRAAPPTWLMYIGNFMLGAGMIMALYFSLCLLPLLPIGLIGILGFGLGIHAFAPLALLITLSIYSLKDTKKEHERWALLAGLGSPLMVSAIFAINWNIANSKIQQALQESTQNKELPSWVNVAQQLPDNHMTQTLLTGDFRYDLFKADNFNFLDWNRTGTTLDRGRVHNPLLNIAHLFTGSNGLTEAERIKILRTAKGARHQTERKLWTGRDLSVSNMETKVEIYPKYRMAYTEKTFLIKNNARYHWDQQEALFTFYLTEGSTATSLSLWVNGKEEKSRLTTREKADSAYVSIVGVERRDPALLHWQEGNRLTLTVFPCTPAEPRKVKLGITTPLRIENERMSYRSIVVESPMFYGKNMLEVSVTGKVKPEEKPAWLKGQSDYFTYKGRPRDEWGIHFPVLELPEEPFVFNNNCYHLQNIEPQPVAFKPEQVFLDVNASWTKAEFEGIFQIYKDTPVFAYDQKIIPVDEDSKDRLFKKLRQRRFSILPLQLVSDPENNLLITKEGAGTPYFGDLEEAFSQPMIQWSQKSGRLMVFCLSKDLPGYLERFTYSQKVLVHNTNPKDMQAWKKQNTFPDYTVEPFSATVLESGIKIVKTPNCNQESEAPDHLLRLYNYNFILEKSRLPGQDDQSLIDLANEAFVVSPISSAIVLETVKDYERFGIDTNEKSLKNAKLKGAGAVPEPHEWALIILCGIFIIWAYYRQWIR